MFGIRSKYDIHRDGDAGVTEPLLHDLRMDVLANIERRSRAGVLSAPTKVDKNRPQFTSP